MKRSLIPIVLLIAVGATSLYAFQQPTISITPATPNTVYVNSQSLVTITAEISDPTVITNSVTLVQVDPVTQQTLTVAGTLSSNPASSTNEVFSIVIKPATTVPALLMYRVSAAFRGRLQRSLSQPITVAIAPIGVALPPDPGPAGIQTLAGVDSDRDGVRDDVERWIATTYYSSAKMRSGLSQYARTVQLAIGHPRGQSSFTLLVAVLRAQFCINYTEYTLERDDYSYKSALTLQLNTYPRAKAFYSLDAAAGGHAFCMPQVGHETEACDVNPLSLPN